MACYRLQQPQKDRPYADRLIATSQQFPRFGYRRMAVWLSLSEKRVRRLWSQLGLQLPRRCSRKRRLGTDIRLPGAPRPNSVWTYDFVHDRLADKTNLKLLCVLDEYTRECLAIEVARSMSSMTVIQTLARLMRLHGKPSFIRSDQGAEFTAGAVMRWLRDQNVGPMFKPWQNGFVESFNGKLRDECLSREWFRDLRESSGGGSFTTNDDRAARLATGRRRPLESNGLKRLRSISNSQPEWLQKGISGHDGSTAKLGVHR